MKTALSLLAVATLAISSFSGVALAKTNNTDSIDLAISQRTDSAIAFARTLTPTQQSLLSSAVEGWTAYHDNKNLPSFYAMVEKDVSKIFTPSQLKTYMSLVRLNSDTVATYMPGMCVITTDVQFTLSITTLMICLDTAPIVPMIEGTAASFRATVTALSCYINGATECPDSLKHIETSFSYWSGVNDTKTCGGAPFVYYGIMGSYMACGGEWSF